MRRASTLANSAATLKAARLGAARGLALPLTPVDLAASAPSAPLSDDGEERCPVIHANAVMLGFSQKGRVRVIFFDAPHGR